MDTGVLHDRGKHIDWSESLSFSFYDRGKDVCGTIGIDIRPNHAVKEIVSYFMMPDGSVVSQNDAVPFDRMALEAKGLRFRTTEPEHRWNISFLGGMERTTERKAKKSHVELNLDFEGLNEAFDFRSCPCNKEQRVPAPEHVEQSGRFRGSISTGLDDFSIDALGAKVHRWGIRSRKTLRSETVLSCQFSDSLAMGMARRVDDQFTVDAGYVFTDGRNRPVNRLELNVSSDFDRSPKSFDMAMVDVDGQSHKVFGSVVKRVKFYLKTPPDTPPVMVHRTLVRCTFLGRNGYGVAEFMNRT